MDFEISLATTRHELFEAASLRYEVAVLEMGLAMKYSNHPRRLVSEPLDETGHVLLAHCGSRLVATMRTNLLRDGDIGYYHEAYGISQLPSIVDPNNVSISTRLVVAKGYRGENVAPIIQTAAFQYARALGVTHDVVDCRKRLVPYFQRLGYKVHTGDLEHPEFGEVVVQIIDLRDYEHLRKVRSPLIELRPMLKGALKEIVSSSEGQ
jgi:GNAT superfamily N-acetyltransferase